MNTGDIYAIKNKVNDKIYIGQTKSYRKKGLKQVKFGYQGRYKEHVSAASTKPTYGIDREMAKLGVNNFYVELLDTCEISELDNKEVFYIKKYNTIVPNGYNVVLGNPSKNTNPEHVSKQLIEYYKDNKIKKKHSDVHKDKFAEIKMDDLKEIEIKPIKQQKNNKLIYVYFKYSNGNTVRRRYGGIHIDFQDNYQRCIKDLESFQGITIVDYVKNPNTQLLNKLAKSEEIKDILLTIFKMKNKSTIALYLNYAKGRKRIVFGGKTITYDMAFKNAIDYIKLNKLETNKIVVSESLKATLPNCGGALKNINTTS